MTDSFSKKDKKDWEKFILGKDKLPDKDEKFVKHKKLKSKPIDLHGYTLDGANEIVFSTIINSYIEGVSKLIIITGKGLHSQNEKDPYVSKDFGILKYSVPDFIKGNNKLMKLISKIEDAKIEDGGSGAFYVYLKKNKK